jgi:hypothetical protein
MSSLIGPSAKAILENAAQQVFDTFKRPFTLYIDAQQTSLSTSPNYSRFGQHDQNVFNPAVNPQKYVISGCLLYQNMQQYEFVEPQNRTNYQQDKLRNSFGILRLKVDGSGYSLLQGTKLINVDGFDFQLVSNARPHGMFDNPTRFTFTLIKVD